MLDTIGYLLHSTVSSASPILLAALGGMFTYYSNVFNIAMEGMMLTGAFFAVYGSYTYDSWFMGMLFAILSGVIMAIVFSLLAVFLRVDEFITGIGINMAAVGLTTYLLRSIFKVKGAFISQGIVAMPKWRLPLFERVPLIGDILSNHPFVVYVAVLLALFCELVIFETRFGIHLRAVGEDEQTAKSVGINSNAMKFISAVLSGILSSLGGVYLSLGYVSLFSENMSNGRGWISLAIIILVKGRPIHILLLSLLFGFFESLGLTLQHYKLAPQFTAMIPYVATLFVLYSWARRKFQSR